MKKGKDAIALAKRGVSLAPTCRFAFPTTHKRDRTLLPAALLKRVF
ncbi:MAG: hypothetical protein AB1861_07610 [Cyanobacteriota bacterium]